MSFKSEVVSTSPSKCDWKNLKNAKITFVDGLSSTGSLSWIIHFVKHALLQYWIIPGLILALAGIAIYLFTHFNMSEPGKNVSWVNKVQKESTSWISNVDNKQMSNQSDIYIDGSGRSEIYKELSVHSKIDGESSGHSEISQESSGHSDTDEESSGNSEGEVRQIPQILSIFLSRINKS